MTTWDTHPSTWSARRRTDGWKEARRVIATSIVGTVIIVSILAIAYIDIVSKHAIVNTAGMEALHITR